MRDWIVAVAVLSVTMAVLGDAAGEGSAGKCARFSMGVVFLCVVAKETAALFGA